MHKDFFRSKNKNIEKKNDFFNILAQNIHSGYTFFFKRKDQRTNGPVNAHLRPEIYTNKLV